MQYKPFAANNLGDIIRLGIEMQKEGDFNEVPFDIETAAHSIMRLVVDNPNGFGMLAYTDDGKAVGMIAGSVMPYFFSKGSVANDFVWFVLPEHRGSRASLKLLNMFTDWAREKGASALYMGITTNITSDRTGELFKKRGFEHVGGNYRKRFNAES